MTKEQCWMLYNYLQKSRVHLDIPAVHEMGKKFRKIVIACTRTQYASVSWTRQNHFILHQCISLQIILMLCFQAVSFLSSYNCILYAFLFTVMRAILTNCAIHLTECTNIMCRSVQTWSCSLYTFLQPALNFLSLWYKCSFQYIAVKQSQHPRTFLRLYGKN